MKQEWPPEAVPGTDTAAAHGDSEITTTECLQCGAEVHGLNGRYACGLCGWVNHWSQGSTTLPQAEDDPAHPGR
jgi:ribosomal protein S27AE